MQPNSSADGPRVKAPSSVNWKTAGKVTGAKNQGTCGSCWSFSTTAVAESYLAIYNNNLLDLSEEYVLECTSGSDCSGGYVNRAFSVIADGQPTEAAYPYKGYSSGSSTPKTSGICQATNKVAMPSGTYPAGKSDLSNEDFKSLIAVAPVAALFYASSSGFSSYGSGTYSCSKKAGLGDLDHAVQVIGYDNNGNYIIKNSWGTSWGDDGTAVINKDPSKNCGINLRVYYFAGANGDNNSVFSSGERLVMLALVGMVALMM